MTMNEPNGWDDDLDDLADGWGEDNDDFFNDDEARGPESDEEHPFELDNNANAAEGWDDDEDLLDEDTQGTVLMHPLHSTPPDLDTKDTTPPVVTQVLPSANRNRLAQELSEYITSLPQHVSSIQMVLDAEYNTKEKAMELRSYYCDRPELVDYTIEKEVDRMDYTVVLAGDVSSDKKTVQEMLRNADSLCSRCANQSLLADIVQVLTGNDRVVRPQHMATAIASKCQFHVDLDDSIVQGIATLELSLPTVGGRWKVAEIRVFVVFEPEQPGVDFQLAEIRLMPRTSEWDAMLNDSAELLEMLVVEEQLPSIGPPQQPDLNFRDTFLQSQNLLQVSAVGAVKGMRSAWQDIDAATGFGHKIKNILPDTDTLVQQSDASTMEDSFPKHRPTSILGGFVRSLAKSVTIPEEALQPPPTAPKAPKLYNLGPERTNATIEDECTAPMQLHNQPIEEPSNPVKKPQVAITGDLSLPGRSEITRSLGTTEPQNVTGPHCSTPKALGALSDGWKELRTAELEIEGNVMPHPHQPVDVKIRERKRWNNPRANAPRSLGCA